MHSSAHLFFRHEMPKMGGECSRRVKTCFHPLPQRLLSTSTLRFPLLVAVFFPLRFSFCTDCTVFRHQEETTEEIGPEPMAVSGQVHTRTEQPSLPQTAASDDRGPDDMFHNQAARPDHAESYTAQKGTTRKLGNIGKCSTSRDSIV